MGVPQRDHGGGPAGPGGSGPSPGGGRGGRRPPLNPWITLAVALFVLFLIGGFPLLFRLRWLLLAALAAIIARETWQNWRQAMAPERLRELAGRYAALRLEPGRWPPRYPPPLDDVAGLIRAADLGGAGPEYVGQALDMIRRTWGAHFARRWAEEHPGLTGRGEYLQAYVQTFGDDPGYADYLHLVLEARYRRGLRPEETRAELERLSSSAPPPH